MIEDLLELEKIESGGLVIKKEKLLPHSEINEILSTIEALLVEKKLVVENLINEDLIIKTDKRKHLYHNKSKSTRLVITNQQNRSFMRVIL